MNQKSTAFRITFFTVVFLFMAGSAFAALRVNVMPSGVNSKVNAWDSNPYTWPGNALELWGNVIYDGAGTLTYTWDFGDGLSPVSGTVAIRNNIRANHVYAGTGSFIATLTVTNGVETDTDTVRIDVVNHTAEVETNLAIQRALKYIYMNYHIGMGDGYYFTSTSDESIEWSGLAVLAMENHGHLESNDHNKDIYADYVEWGINYLSQYLYVSFATRDDINYRDSDINGNGLKVYTPLYNYFEIFSMGITSMVLAATKTPDAVFRNCAASGIRGKTYKVVLEDMVDGMAYAQSDGGVDGYYTKGWGPFFNSPYCDNSMSFWAVLGLAEAEKAPFHIAAPSWVKTRLHDWITYTQHPIGGFGSTSPIIGINASNTGAGILEMYYSDQMAGSISNAVNFILSNWPEYDPDSSFGDLYAMYSVKKSMELGNLSMIGAHSWQDEYNAWLVENQLNQYNGTSFPDSSLFGFYAFKDIACPLEASSIMGLLVMASIDVCKPIANAGPDQTIHAGKSVILDGSASSDPDGDSITYVWEIFSKPSGSTAVLSDASAVNPSFTADRPGNYVIQLVVTDSNGAASQPSYVTISTFNSAPIAEAGDDQALTTRGKAIELNGAQSYDPDGDPITFSWIITEKPAGSLAQLSDAAVESPSITPDVYGTYTIELSVTDPFGTLGTDTVKLSFDNLKPVASAGQNQSLMLGNTATLDGSASSDPNLDPLIYAWSISSAPVGSFAAITDPSAIKASIQPDLEGTYVLSLMVNDGLLDSDPSNVTLTVVADPSVITDLLTEGIDMVNTWDMYVFKNKNMAKAVTNKFNAVIQMVTQGQYADAIDALQNDILKKTDGCVNQGYPDKNDWVMSCEQQMDLYAVVTEAINALKRM